MTTFAAWSSLCSSDHSHPCCTFHQGHYPIHISNISNISYICKHMFGCLTYLFGDISNIFHCHMYLTYWKIFRYIYFKMLTGVKSYVNNVYINNIWLYISWNSSYVVLDDGSSDLWQHMLWLLNLYIWLMLNSYDISFQICQNMPIS